MLRLRPYMPKDAGTVTSWVKDEFSLKQWTADRFDHFPVTADDLNRYYADPGNGPVFPMTAFDGDGVAGHMFMRFLDPEGTGLRFGFVIIDPARRGRGYGREMLGLALKMAFEVMKVRRVTLGVFENNPAAYRCYKAAGFRDVLPDEPVYYHVLGEDWLCLELMIGEAD